jgi:hypothetical protein
MDIIVDFGSDFSILPHKCTASPLSHVSQLLSSYAVGNLALALTFNAPRSSLFPFLFLHYKNASNITKDFYVFIVYSESADCRLGDWPLSYFNPI